MTSDCMSRRISFQFGLVRKKISIPWNSFQIIFKMKWTRIWSTVLFPRSNNSFLGWFWAKTENHQRNIGKMSEKVKKGQKVVEKIWINLGFINFRMDDCVSKSDMARKIRRTGSKEFHYTRKWIGKEKFVKSFGIMRDQKRRMGNYGEPSGNICSDLLIEPQVTSLGHDLKWPHDEHTHTFCRLYLDLPRPKLDQKRPNSPSWTISDWTTTNPFTTEDLPLLYLNYYRLIQPRQYLTAVYQSLMDHMNSIFGWESDSFTTATHAKVL